MCDAESKAKAAFLTEVMGADGAENYHEIIDFMRPRAAALIDASAWYLSIVGVAPSAQGRGIGARLLERTLAEADEAGVNCYPGVRGDISGTAAGAGVNKGFDPDVF